MFSREVAALPLIFPLLRVVALCDVHGMSRLALQRTCLHIAPDRALRVGEAHMDSHLFKLTVPGTHPAPALQCCTEQRVETPRLPRPALDSRPCCVEPHLDSRPRLVRLRILAEDSNNRIAD